MKKKILFVITQFYKGGAEVALLNLFRSISKENYEIDFLIFDQMILSNATSLIPYIPDWIEVCDAAKREGKYAVIVKILFKIIQKFAKRQLYRPCAYRFVKDKEYDLAFSYGEWLSPEFVAKRVNAKKKMIWIHTDIDKALYVKQEILFGYNSHYNQYIFVSEHSRKSAEQQFPILNGKSVVIHNMCDDLEIKKKAEELEHEDGDILFSQTDYLLSVGNLRDEKNYPRQVEVMRSLVERGVFVKWLCIGSKANIFLYEQLKKQLEKNGLTEYFQFLGAKENPYPYMKHAKAIMVLSDFESWSIVITEAKLLGRPVIATRTSGACEQIEDGKTGILTDFKAEDIADKIQFFLNNTMLQQRIERNLQGFHSQKRTIEEFERVVKGESR